MVQVNRIQDSRVEVSWVSTVGKYIGGQSVGLKLVEGRTVGFIKIS